MAYLLFPGRHLLNTRFQEQYLFETLNRPIAELPTIGGPAPAGTLDQVIFAITSANQQNSRYNPVPFHARAIGVDRLARRLKDALGVAYRIVGVPHFGQSAHFAEHTLKELHEQTELVLSPANTVVLCSTPGLIRMYQALGFAILTAEYLSDSEPAAFRSPLPIALVQRIATLDADWKQDALLREQLAPSSYGLLADFPEVPARIARLYRDPLLNDEGSLTDTRDYQTYARSMESIIDLKYREIAPGLVPGKIVDEGCADGGLLVRIARDFPDSDLIGIDIATEFIARCHERQRSGEFGGTFVHFHQRNLLSALFEPATIDTTICNSTLHELWSYGDQEQTVRAYLANKYAQTRRGGRLVIRDVVGFAERDRLIAMWCNPDDGSNEAPLAVIEHPRERAAYLEGLSTRARFKRFAEDFLADMRKKGKRPAESQVRYEERTIAGREVFVLRFQDAVEFLSKKDYTDNWSSEMNEEFAFWSFEEWKAALATAGFTVLENPNAPESGSRAYLSDWRVTHSFLGKVSFFDLAGTPLDYPPTNMVLIGEK